MKKKIAIIGIIIFLLMLIPIPSAIKDGGSVCYQAVLYQVTKYHRMDEKSENGYIGGWNVKILGFDVYENTYPIER